MGTRPPIFRYKASRWTRSTPLKSLIVFSIVPLLWDSLGCGSRRGASRHERLEGPDRGLVVGFEQDPLLVSKAPGALGGPLGGPALVFDELSAWPDHAWIALDKRSFFIRIVTTSV